MRRSYTRAIALILVVGLMFAFGSILPPSPLAADPSELGFFAGLVHGAMTPITLLASFINSNVRVYAFPNAGWRYDFGFVLAIGLLSSGVAVGMIDELDRPR